jgi:hypothetical protein
MRCGVRKLVRTIGHFRNMRYNGYMCTVEDCSLPVRAIGLCAKHYAREYRRRNAKPRAVRVCSIEGCEAVHEARGLCSAHYQRLIRYPKLSADPEYRERENARLRALADSRRAYERERSKAHRATPEGRAAHRRRESERRARVRGLNYEVFTDEEMLALYGADCHICGGPIDLEAPRRAGVPGWEHGLQREHVIPISGGGPTTLENCRPAHGLCNIKKGRSLAF